MSHTTQINTIPQTNRFKNTGNQLGKRYKGVGTAPERLPIVGDIYERHCAGVEQDRGVNEVNKNVRGERRFNLNNHSEVR